MIDSDLAPLPKPGPQTTPIEAGRSMLNVHSKKSCLIVVVVSFAALTLPVMRSHAQSAAPIDGPAGYTVACSIGSAPGYRACNELPSASSCDSEPNYASLPSKEPTGITFVNRSDQPVKVYWLSFQGERRLYQYLPPSGRYAQDTFTGHNWLVATLAERCIGIFKASGESIAFF